MSDAYQSENLDHLGLVAGMYDELGIGEVLDHLIVQDDEKRTVSVGQAVKAMVLNGLCFVNQRLYLIAHFFENKPTARLVGPGITASHLNDDVLGRALDTLYAHDVTAPYRQVAHQAAQRLRLDGQYVHLDSSSFHVDGRYNSDEPPAEGVIHITRGYSRDHRPDLNQVVLDLICEQQAGIPLLMEPVSGNSNDKSDFRRVVQTHVAQLQHDHTPSYLVADSSRYRCGTDAPHLPDSWCHLNAAPPLAAAPGSDKLFYPGYQSARCRSAPAAGGARRLQRPSPH
jgi:transposase